MTDPDFQPGDELPDRRRHGYKELNDKLEKHAAHIENRLRRFFTRALMAFAILGLTSAGSLLGYGLVLKKETRFSQEIQDQRFRSVLQQCLDQNRKHDRAIKAGSLVLSRDNLAAFKALVDELAPFEPDCIAYTQNLVKAID